MLAIYSRAYSRNLGQRSILARKGTFFIKKGTFFEKRSPKISPYSILFLSVLHQNKTLYNFLKKRQLSIVECNIDLKYVLYRFFVKPTSLYIDSLSKPRQSASGILVIVMSIFLIEILLRVDLCS